MSESRPTPAVKEAETAPDIPTVSEQEANVVTGSATNVVPAEEAADSDSSYWTVARVTMFGTGGLIGIILLLFIIALAIAILGDPVIWAARMQYFRDLFLITLTLSGILIIAALAILVVQIARFVNLLRSEVKPIMEDTQQAMKDVRVSAQFTAKHATEPLIKSQSFFTGFGVFSREMLRITRLARRRVEQQETTDIERTTDVQ